ncbi:MAG: succinate-semialdehyde dehydrogenase / glutarate-semialdehyde dehydrogenase, partial [Phycisphaerales bacterium]|nr:succinate-semialdehyde dehydrogenase / glutarate-semialdehyde dehydrogenase [Phycisphaerales bacterium]
AKARADYLLAIAAELNRRGEEIAKLVTQENGKPLSQSRGEVAMSVDHLRWFAEECRRAYGRMIPHQTPGKRNFVIKHPVGVVGAISPWNFPLVLSVRKIAPALAAGCPTILKPASQTPLCNIAFAECCDAAKLPKGVFQLVIGAASMIGEEFLSNPICRKITFTGSTEVGQKLIAGAARDVKRLSLELGGHAPCIVFDDADPNRAVEGVLMAKFRNTGQSCIAANRIYVQAGIYDRFVAAFVERTKALKTGNGLEGEQDIGPVVNEKGLKFALDQIEDAKQRGARILTGGKRLNRAGFFLEPTVIADVPDDASCMHEETFAPVAPIVRFEREEDAIRKANDSPFGLSAYAFTSNLDRMFRVAEKLEAGTIGINDGVPTTSNAPFGGMKHSGWGRELGSEGLDAFLETKHVSIGVIE